MWLESKKINKTRKEHTYLGCLKKIPKLDSCWYEKGIFQKEFQYFYICNECKDCLKYYKESFRDGFIAGEVGIFRKKICRQITKNLFNE